MGAVSSYPSPEPELQQSSELPVQLLSEQVSELRSAEVCRPAVHEPVPVPEQEIRSCSAGGLPVLQERPERTCSENIP